ncbi:MAG: hypothetical protein ACI9O4_001389 [Chitinophagales bacterium]|jgi:hypothetical protein
MEIEGILALLVPFAGIAMIFGIVYVERSATSNERMSMLDKGFTPQEISDAQQKRSSPEKNLSNGLLLVGAATGVLIGFFLSQSFPIKPILAYVTCGFLFGGLGLLIASLIQSKKTNP